ncbi:MAG: hypothetical protein ACKPEZ_17840 [Planktothrix sp.]
MRRDDNFIERLTPQFLLEFSNYAPIGKIKPVFLRCIQNTYYNLGIEKAIYLYNRIQKSLNSNGRTIFLDNN